MQNSSLDRTKRRTALSLGVLVVTTTLGFLTLTAASAQATGLAMDCNHDGQVLINEIITGVNIALGTASLGTCPPADSDGDGIVTIADIIRGVDADLGVQVGRPPFITDLTVVAGAMGLGDNLSQIDGFGGTPGSVISVDIRQATFNDGGAKTFHPCQSIDAKTWIQLGTATVSANGTWTISGIDQQVMPSNISNLGSCHQDPSFDGGLYSQFRINSSFGNGSPVTPQLTYWHERDSTASGVTQHVLEATISGGDNDAVGITDGPDQDPNSFGGPDESEHWAYTCSTPGLTCDQSVAFGGGTFPAPAQTEQDYTVCSAIGGCTYDNEFPFILSMAQGHKPGGSILAFMKTPRAHPPVTAFTVNVHVSGSIGINVHFSFF